MSTVTLEMFLRLEKRLAELEVKLARLNVSMPPVHSVKLIETKPRVEKRHSSDPEPDKRRRITKSGMYTIFTDGSAVANGKPDCMAGCGVYVKEIDFRWQGKPDGDQSSNRGELQAGVVAAALARHTPRVVVWTDSEYMFLGITEKTRLEHWVRNSWKKKSGGTAANIDLWKAMWVLLQRREIEGLDPIEWRWTRSHNGDNTQDPEVNRGNCIADQLAGAGRYKPSPWPDDAGKPLKELIARFSMT